MKSKINFWKQFSLTIFAQAISVLSQVVVLSEIYKSSDSNGINQALLLFSIGQSLTFLDFGSNASIIRASAFLSVTKNSVHQIEIVNIVRRLALISIVNLLILFLLLIFREDIRIFLLYTVFVVASTFLNLFVNILRGFGSLGISNFTNAIPLFFAAIGSLTLGGKISPQYVPMIMIVIGCLYGVAAFFVLRHRVPELRLFCNEHQRHFLNFKMKSFSNFRVSLDFWVSQICFVVFLNFDRFVVINSENLLIAYSPYVIVFIGFTNLLWNASSNHAVMNIHEDFSDQKSEESRSNRLVALGFILAFIYPVMCYLYVSQTLGLREFSFGLSMSFSLQLLLLSALLNYLIFNSSTHEVNKRARVFLGLVLLQVTFSSMVIKNFGLIGSPVTMNIATLAIILLLIGLQYFKTRVSRGGIL
jgi:hypothetical protein